jgi:hypothetical protein
LDDELGVASGHEFDPRAGAISVVANQQVLHLTYAASARIRVLDDQIRSGFEDKLTLYR